MYQLPGLKWAPWFLNSVNPVLNLVMLEAQITQLGLPVPILDDMFYSFYV